jgi:hypothetical protein
MDLPHAESSNLITTPSEKTSRASMARGCPQGSVLLPLLRSVAVDELLWELNDND